MRKIAVIAAGGSGSRMNLHINKILMDLNGKTVLQRTLEAFTNLIDEMIISARAEDEDAIRQIISLSAVSYPVHLVSGGKSRQESVLNGLKFFRWEPEDIVLVHDAARCMADPGLIERAIMSCLEYGSGVPALPAVSTFKLCDANNNVISTVPRSSLFEIQTPQVFFGQKLLLASLAAASKKLDVTDDASVMEAAGYPVHIVPGSRSNIKITTMEDYMFASRLLDNGKSKMRIGIGYDVHRLVQDRKLVLCGVEIPWELGLLGHSDADVAVHALIDSMLGAAALGDIGQHFPDSDPEFSGISSLKLLKKTAEILQQSGYYVINADIVISAQKPKLLHYISQMRKNIADTLNCDIGNISVKATTTEHLGFEGRMEGISSQAVCMIGTY